MEIVASWPSQMPLRDVPAWARRVEDLGFDVMHVPETIHDPFTVGALALTATSRLVVRTSMVVAFARSPMLTAYAAWDLAALSEGRFQLGVASQVRGNVVGRFSAEWSEPVARLRDYVASLRAIFAAFRTGEPLDHQGPHYRFDRLQPYFNPGPLGCPEPTIWTGGVNQRMTTLAGEVADGFVCHPTSSHPEVIRALLRPALDDGCTLAGRTDGGPLIVAGPQPLTAADRDELEGTREQRREELAFLYSTPAYRRQLEVFGLAELGETLSAMAARGDWSGLAAHLDDDVMRTLLPEGTYAELPDVLDRWYAGLCHGLVLSARPDEVADDRLGDVVRRCREIASAAT